MRNMTENFVKSAEPAAGVMGSGKEDLGQELEIKSQHATPPFRWKGAADLKARSALPPAPTEMQEAGDGLNLIFLEVHGGFKEVRSGLQAAGVGLRRFVGGLGSNESVLSISTRAIMDVSDPRRSVPRIETM